MKELICITCPKGCHLKVDEENGKALEITPVRRRVEVERPEVKKNDD